jgi:hypothetical protein
MARILTRSFETGTLETTVTPLGSGGAVSTTQKRTGEYSLHFNESQTERRISFSFISGSREIYMGMGLYTGAAPATTRGLVTIRTEADAVVFTIAQNAAGYLLVYYGTTAGTLLYTGTDVMGATWNYIQFHGATDASAGIAELKINGDLVYSGSGLNTGTSSMALMSLYKYPDTSSYYFDDIVVNDTLGADNNGWTGQPRLIPIYVDGAGDATELTRGGTDSGANWNQVDEVPAADTDYVYGTTANYRDLYTVDASTLSLPEDTVITNVHVVLRSKAESGAAQQTAVLSYSLTEAASAVTDDLSNSFDIYTHAFPKNVESALAWDEDDIASIQIGPKLVG